MDIFIAIFYKVISKGHSAGYTFQNIIAERLNQLTAQVNLPKVNVHNGSFKNEHFSHSVISLLISKDSSFEFTVIGSHILRVPQLVTRPTSA